MANLKDINYGIGKYLELSDASAIPDIGTNRKNLDLLNFKVATNNAYALYNFKDGMIDAYQTQAGVDTSGSTALTYNSTDKCYVTKEDAVTFEYTGSVQNYTVPTGKTSLIFKVWGAGGGSGGYDGAGSGYGTGTIAVTGGDVLKIVVGGGGTNGGGSEGAGAGGLSGIFYPTELDTSNPTYARLIAGGGGGAGRTSNLNPGSGGGTTGRDALNHAGQGPDAGGHGGSQVGGGPAGTPNGPGGSSTAGSQFQGGASGNGSATGGYGGGGNGSTGGGGPGGGGGGWYGGGGGGNTGGGGGGSGYYNTSYVTSATLTQGGAPATAVKDAANMGDSDYVTDVGMGGSGGTGGHGYVIIPEATNNITLLSNAQTAQADPAEGRLLIYEESIDSVTPGTDIKGYVSRDGGTTYTETPLTTDGPVDTIFYAGNTGGVGRFPGFGGNDSLTKLLIHCDGTQGQTSFSNSAVGGSLGIGGGGVTKNTSVKKFGTASADFTGASGHYLYAESSTSAADFNFGTNDWTFDFWMNISVTGGSYLFNKESGSTWLRAEAKSGGIEFNFYKAGSYANGWTFNCNWPGGDENNILNKWTHVVLGRDGTVIRGFIDGVESSDSAHANPVGTNNISNPASLFFIGMKYNGAGGITGYIDEFRYSFGAAGGGAWRYVANFTPSTTEFTADTNTKLLLHMDGTNDGTNFIDSSSSPHTVTPVGGVHTDTAVKKIGTASAQFDDSGDYLSIPDSADFNFSGSFTIEAWVRFNALTFQPIYSQGLTGSGVGEHHFCFHNSNGLQYIHYPNGGGAYDINIQQGSTSGWAVDTWYHVAVVRNGYYYELFRDGTRLAIIHNTTAIGDKTSPVLIGAIQDSTISNVYDGYIDELRVSNSARYTADFDPADVAYNALPYEAPSTANISMFSGSADISGQPAGSNMKYKVETLNNKNLKLHGASLLWA